MLFLFRTRQTLFNLLLLIYAAILQLRTFFLPPVEIPAVQGLLSFPISNSFDPGSATVFFFRTFLLFVEGFLINEIVARNRIAGEYNLLPGLFFILIASFIPEFIQLSPLHLVNILLLLTLRELYETYRLNEAATRIINIGLLIGISSLFYFSTLFFLLWAINGINTMRSLKLKEVIMLLSGALIPYIFAFTWFFWHDQLPFFYERQFGNAAGFLVWSATTYYGAPFKLAIFGLFIIITLAGYSSFMLRKTNKEVKKIDLLYSFMLASALALFFQANVGLSHLLLLSMPLGILLSFSFEGIRNRWGEFLHLLLLVLTLLLQYRLFLFPA